MRWGVVVFPGSNDDRDTAYALGLLPGHEVEMLWHADAGLRGVDAVVLPGGFSYGDYLRCGALARFSPVMSAVAAFARDGGPVLGICNGFQILCEAGLLPGALVRNRSLRFDCRRESIRVESAATAFTAACQAGDVLDIPVKHGEGCYVAAPEVVDRLEAEGRIVFRYEAGSANGSVRDIAGVSSEAGNVVGLMPHPEHAVDPDLGSQDGAKLFLSAALWLGGQRGAGRAA